LLGIASAVFLGLSPAGLTRIIFLSLVEKEKEEKAGVVVRDTTLRLEIEKTISSVKKVPSQYPLVLLGVNDMIRINSKFNFYGVGLHSSEI
jgi:hypothetical protein